MTAGTVNSTATTDLHGNFSAIVDSAVTNETVIQEFDGSFMIDYVGNVCVIRLHTRWSKTRNLEHTVLVRRHTRRPSGCSQIMACGQQTCY